MPKKNTTGIDNLLSGIQKESDYNSDPGSSLDAAIASINAPLLHPANAEPAIVGNLAAQMRKPMPLNATTPEQAATNVLQQQGTGLRLAGLKPPVPAELAPEPAPRPASEGMLVPNPNWETFAGEAAKEAEAQRTPQAILENTNPSLAVLNLANAASGREGYPQIARGAKELAAGGIEPGIADLGEGAFKAATPLLIASGVASPVKVAGALATAVAAGYAAEKGAKALGANEDEQRIANLIGALAGGAITGGKAGFFERRARLTSGIEEGLRAQGIEPELAKNVAADAVQKYEATGDARFLGTDNATTPGAGKVLGFAAQDIAGAASGAASGAIGARKPELDISHLPTLKAAIEKAAEPQSANIDHLPALKAALEKEARPLSGQPNSDFAANINLSKLQTSDDVLNLIRETAKANGDFETQRRGVVSHEETQKAAAELGITAEKVAQWKPGKAVNAETLLAARRINVATSEAVRAAAKDFQANDSTENLLRVQAAMQQHAAVLQSVSGATAEAGRALNQFKIAARALQDAQPSNYDKVLQALGGREVSAEMARKLAEIPEDDVVGLNKFLRGATEFSTADKVSAYWTNSVLSGPRTHLRNLISNVTFSAIQIPQKAIRGWVDLPLSKLADRPQEYYAREAIPAAFGMFAGLPDGLRRASYIIRNGFDVRDAAKLDTPHQYEFSGPAAVFNLPGRFLVASDAMSKTMLLQSEIYALATRQALREGLRGAPLRNRIADIVSDPSPDMVNKAVEFSKYATFNASPQKFTRQVIGLREAEVFGIKPLRFVIPFINTPANIAKIGFEYSPIGFAKLAKTGLKSPEASEVIAKATIGTMAMAGFAGLAASGRLTGAAPSDPAKRDAWYRAGKQPFSVKIGNRWVAYNQMVGPLAMTLAATAAFWDSFSEKGEVPTSKRIATAGAVIGQSVTDATFFRGIENLINALTDPEKQGERFVSDLAGGFVPMSGFVRNIGNALDPTIHDPQGIYERILTGLPIVSKQVPPKLDVFGREQQMEGGQGLLAFLPSRIPEDVPRSPIDAELNRLEVYPGKPSGSLTLKNHKMELTREQKAELQKDTGRVMYFALNSLFDSDAYKQLTDEQKQKAANQLIERTREAAREMFIANNAAKLTLKK